MAQTIAILYLLTIFFSSCFAANICDICECQPNKQQVFSITCDGQNMQDLHLTSSMMIGVNTATMVIIKNCNTVSIERNSFAQIHKLDTLGIQNCAHLYIASGSFSKLNSLLINNVEDVYFGEMAFMGARDVKNIVINSSNITEIPKFALYDVQGLERLNLYNVNIEKIQPMAINLHATSVGIENIKVTDVGKDGLVIDALKIFIKTSIFENLKPSAVKLATAYQTRLLNNHFKTEFLIEINSPFAEFSGNIFRNLTSNAFKSIVLPRLMNNTIIETDFEKIFHNFEHKDFHHNLFTCLCNKNMLNFTKHSFNYEILKKNYCNTNCSLSLFDFEVETSARCIMEKFVDVSSLCVSTVDSGTSYYANEIQDNTPVVLRPRFLNDEDHQDDGESAESGSTQLRSTLFAIVVVLLMLKM
ncbi:hypothetical protein FQR65_LT06462 [Abscondita terminalis]|nr:hypothetical protein FQR65_LT06462 [Abscondita terminalis]